MVQFPFVVFQIQHLPDSPLIYVYGGHLELQNGDREFFFFSLSFYITFKMLNLCLSTILKKNSSSPGFPLKGFNNNIHRK